MTKFNINFTTSKLLAYIILVIGSVYAFINKDSNVLIATFSAASAVIALKTWTASKERIKNYPNDEKPPGDI